MVWSDRNALVERVFTTLKKKKKKKKKKKNEKMSRVAILPMMTCYRRLRLDMNTFNKDDDDE